MSANTKDTASACADLASSMEDTIFVLEQLVELAIERMPNNTDSDHSVAAMRAAKRYVGDLHGIHSQLEKLHESVETKGGSQ